MKLEIDAGQRHRAVFVSKAQIPHGNYGRSTVGRTPWSAADARVGLLGLSAKAGHAVSPPNSRRQRNRERQSGGEAHECSVSRSEARVREKLKVSLETAGDHGPVDAFGALVGAGE